MKTPHFTTDPIINRLLCRYDIDDYIVIVRFGKEGDYTFIIPEPYLSQLLGDKQIAELWLEQESQDLIDVTDILEDVRDTIARHGFNCAIVAHSKLINGNFYRNSAN